MTLDQIFNKHGADKGSIAHNFSIRYEPLFEPIRNDPIVLLECGIQFGCSARAWLEYFPKAQIYGVDCLNEHGISDPRFHFEIGNQRDHAFWHQWTIRNPLPNVVIDDAEHRADASKTMFDHLWDHLQPGGIYAIEDVCTWFDPHFASALSGQAWQSELFSCVNHRGKS